MADIFDVIADGTRRDILQFLLDRISAGEHGTSVSHIVHELGVSQPTVSKHLKVLREAASSQRAKRVSTATTAFPRPLDDVDDWLVPFLGTMTESTTRSADRLAAHAPIAGERASAKHARRRVKAPGRWPAGTRAGAWVTSPC